MRPPEASALPADTLAGRDSLAGSERRNRAPGSDLQRVGSPTPRLTRSSSLRSCSACSLRLYALGRGTINSDQAVVGLMAREILHGHFFAFYWGQNYGGPEAYVVAAVFALFGSSAFTLGLYAPCFYAPARSCSCGVIGKRMFGASVGAVAAIAFWVWPETYVTSSTVEDGFRWLALICGLTVLLTVLRIGDGDGTRVDWAALGLGAGVGWWSTPEITYFLVPSGVYLVARIIQRQAKVPLASLLLGLAAAIVGSLPWWWHNLSQHFDSFAGPPQPAPPGPGGAYWWHLGIFDRYVVPLLLGLRLRLTGQWIGPSNVTPHLVNVTIVVLLGWLVYLAVRGRAWLLVLYVAAFPFLYAAQPFSWYWKDGRYAIFLAPAARPRRGLIPVPDRIVGDPVSAVRPGGHGRARSRRRAGVDPACGECQPALPTSAVPAHLGTDELVLVAHEPEQLAHCAGGLAQPLARPRRVCRLLARVRRWLPLRWSRHRESRRPHVHPLSAVLRSGGSKFCARVDLREPFRPDRGGLRGRDAHARSGVQQSRRGRASRCRRSSGGASSITSAT